MADKKRYEIRFCWNGNKRKVDWVDYYDSKKEWRYDIEQLPFDIIDETERICYVDYGDNDDA